MTYEDMADWLYYNLDPNDYTSFKDFYKGVAEEFGINDELARNIALPFWEQIEEPKEKPKPKPKEVK